jgi:hypothetical protein
MQSFLTFFQYIHEKTTTANSTPLTLDLSQLPFFWKNLAEQTERGLTSLKTKKKKQRQTTLSGNEKATATTLEKETVQTPKVTSCPLTERSFWALRLRYLTILVT